MVKAYDLGTGGLMAARKLKTVDRLAKEAGKRARVHLKIDTGLGRLGVLPELVPALCDLVRTLDWVEVEGIASHVASPTRSEHDYFTLMQYEKFLEACRVLAPDHRFLHHFSSSNTVPRLSGINSDAARCQAIIWGLAHYWPLPWPLRPVASFKARVVQVKTLPEGRNMGYTLRYTTTRPTRLAVVPVGVVDGPKPEHAGGGYALVRGTRCPIIGMCSCEMMADVTGAGEVEPEEEVVFIGSQGTETIDAVEFGLMGKPFFMSVLALVSPWVP
ncbi:MAG: alanine racemase C-terminal domain-containing protein [Bacillota bacterium]